MASILARLALDGTAFEAGVRRAIRIAASLGSNLNKVLQPQKLGSQLAGAFTIGAIGAAAKATIDYAGDIQDLADKLGITAEAAQKFDYAFQQTGSSLEQNQALFFKLAQNISAASKGSETILKSFARLNVTAADLKSKRIDEIFAQIGKEVRNGQLTPQRYSDLIELMGKSAASVIPAMKAGFSELANEAERLGLVMSNQTIAQLDNTGDAIDRLVFKSRGMFGEAIVGTLQFGAALKKVYDSKVGRVLFGGSLLENLVTAGKQVGTSAAEATAKTRLPGDPESSAKKTSMSAAEAESRAADDLASKMEEVAEVEKKNFEAARKLAFDRLSNDQKINLLIADRIELMRELNNTNTRDPLFRAQLAGAVLSADAQLLALQKSQKTTNIKPDLNSLQQVGAFTAQRAINIRPEQIAQKQLDTLGKIEQNTRASRGGTVTFP